MITHVMTLNYVVPGGIIIRLWMLLRVIITTSRITRRTLTKKHSSVLFIFVPIIL